MYGVDAFDSSDENVHYLLSNGIVPGFISTIRNRGAQPGRSANKNREFHEAYLRLMTDYFGDSPKYDEHDFERRFRLPRSVFNKIHAAVVGNGVFVRRRDATGKEGIHPLVRIAAALRMLAYGIAADALDEYLQFSEDSALVSLKSFVRLIVTKFRAVYLREPSPTDIQKIYSTYAARGFPGCLGCIDCQHWAWSSCPVAWAGQFKGKEPSPTIVLEAIADADLWIWHCFFGCAGSLNDINVLDVSTTMGGILSGCFPPSFPYLVNGSTRTQPYYLADGIYPDWAIFCKTIGTPTNAKHKLYSLRQESVRKDVERAFGVLVARWHILQRPARLWFLDDINLVMEACIILQNMVFEHRRATYSTNFDTGVLVEELRETFGCGPRVFTWENRDRVNVQPVAVLHGNSWASVVANRQA